MVSIVSAVRDLGRLREITSVLVRHGFGEIVTRIGLGQVRKGKGHTSSREASSSEEESDAMTPEELERGEAERKTISIYERARLVLQDLGPSFIKLGQVASTRPDLLPPELIRELKKLQDDVPSVPFEQIREVIETSLNAPLTDIYVSFEEKPLATASIGQVHRAVIATSDGEKQVVVKVQRPGVGETVARDLELLHVLASAIERSMPETKIYSPVKLVNQFDRAISSEVNFLIEADNAERFAENFRGNEHIRFPKVYRQATSRKVLTMEFFDGKKIDKAVASGADGALIAKRSVGLVIKMIYEDGFFHADPHPGNIIIMGAPQDPIIGLIDLGMVGRLSPDMRDRAIDIMLAAIRKDAYGIADALYAVGSPTRKIDMRVYRAEVAVLAEKYLGKPLKDIEVSSMVKDLVDGAMKFEIEMPSDFMMVGKSLMTIEGIGKQIYPDLDVFSEASPYFTNIVKQRYSPMKLGNELIRGVEQLSRAGYDMPLQLREVLEDLRLGRLSVRSSDPTLAPAIDRFGRRMYSGVVSAALVLGGAELWKQSGAEHFALGLFALAGLLAVRHMLSDSKSVSLDP